MCFLDITTIKKIRTTIIKHGKDKKRTSDTSLQIVKTTRRPSWSITKGNRREKTKKKKD